MSQDRRNTGKMLEGQIVQFSGLGKDDLRKIRVFPDQHFDDMYFFHINQARRAGYPLTELAANKKIVFEPDDRDGRPRVRRFAPYKGQQTSTEGTRFHNPYHFVPLHTPNPQTLTGIDETLGSHTIHAKFGGPEDAVPRYSGRIVCRLTTEGPVVIGARQHQKDEKSIRRVDPFELPLEGTMRPAIPGSTLRGLIASLVEAASCSTLRVLKDQRFSRRADIRGEALSAIGMFVRTGQRWALRPLTQSTREMNKSKASKVEYCPIYLDAYDESHPKSGSFLAKHCPKSWSADHREFWYVDLSHAKPKEKRNFQVGYTVETPPIPEAEWQELSEAKRGDYTRGVLLVFGLSGSKSREKPSNKKHELFLPWPKSRPDEFLSVPDAALEEFSELLKQAAQLARGGDSNDLPYLHEGRNRDDLEPRDGDLVYYEAEAGKVTRLSWSAIWRRSVPGTLFNAIRNQVSPFLVPSWDERDQLTLAERLFGFVEGDGTRALASRVRIAHALAEGEEPKDGWYREAVPLKILASPKPPSPALYLGNEGYLRKKDLDLNRHEPQGRKMYLHHQSQAIEEECYRSNTQENNHQKAEVQPLPKGTSFLFHIDFTNTTKMELGFLLYALQPTSFYRHKIGMGKPLGLGQVRLDPLVIGHIDRRKCYSPGALLGVQYQAVERFGDRCLAGIQPDPLFRRYDHLSHALAKAPTTCVPHWKDLIKEITALIPKKVRVAIEHLGDPMALEAEVSYPLTIHQKTPEQKEQEHFRWFVANDKSDEGRAALGSIDEQGIPTLPRHR